MKVYDREGNPVKDEDVTIFNDKSESVFIGKTDEKGVLSVELPEYEVDGSVKKMSSSYTIGAGNFKKTIELTSNREVVILNQ